MGNKYESLEELRRKKALLKQDVSKLEGLLTFDNTKESLSVITNGFTDKYIEETPDENGDMKVGLKKGAIYQEIRNGVKDKVMNKNSVLGFASSASQNGFIEDSLGLGAAALVGSYAKKNLTNANWKKKIIGLALIYLAPILLKFLREKLENYQKNRSVSSMEKLI